jgi:long-chain fatty acid transport protein
LNRRNASRAHARVLTAVAFASLALSLAPKLDAAGLYFSDRGVRPLGRGGAFVAGADDLGAIWYNPAGIAEAGSALLTDTSFLHFTSSYQRVAVVNDANGNPVTLGSNYYPKVDGSSAALPLPTLAISNNFGLKDFNFAFGLMAPYTALTSYPETTVAFNGGQVSAPQRYSLVTLNGSALVVTGLWASWTPSPDIALGAGAEALVGNFDARKFVSACPPQALVCAQEQPDYDADTQLKVGPIFAPSGNVGAIARVMHTDDAELRIGASFQLPFWIDASGTTDLRLPTAAIFQNASVAGNQIEVKFNLPWIARLGIETRLGKSRATRLEVAANYEAWSMHDKIAITPAGGGIKIQNLVGIPDLSVGTLTETRGFQDTFSIHAGGEHRFPIGQYDFELRAGVMYERSAIPASYLSVLTVDLDKVQASIGASLYLGEKKNLRLDLVVANTFAFDQDVDPTSAKIYKLQIVNANPVPNPTAINGGHYSASAQTAGVGLNWKY